ncbi:MAG: portal protein [Flavobacteriales bacterium]|jgi:hypothetical protein|nr:portal protein [Flavobacteriales bacterium]|tara:strand:- start:7675 stop:9423 length:1749 start_codon:yes stop_codon:yes gene_type:complete
MAEAIRISKVGAIKKKLKILKKRKEPWLPHYQLLGEFINNRKQNFTEANEPGAFLTRELFDNTAAKAAETASSTILAALFPSAAQSFELIPARGVDDTEEHREYMRFITEEAISVMDDSRSGLSVALTEMMLDDVVFGTVGLGIFKTKKNSPLPIRYVSWDVKMMHIDEDENHFVDTVINEKEMTVRQMVLEYGLENLSATNQEKFNNGQETDKVTVIHAIEPRIDGSKTKFGSKNKPISSIHFEAKSEKILRESGFDEMPVLVTRLRKAMGEVQGRSLGMAALPDIIELNVVWETLTVAAEKQADPPLAVLADGDLGTTTIDTSAGAINVFNIAQRTGIAKPIIELTTVGDLQPLVLMVEKLTEAISNHFMIDRLLDLNNETRMTLGEANIRNELRGQSLGSLFTRKKAEIFNNLIERTINILFEDGRLGVISGSPEEEAYYAQGVEPIVIPDQLVEKSANGEEIFKIKYISPAERSIKAEEVQGNIATLEILNITAQINPESIDNIDLDALIRRTSELTGASKEMVRGLDIVEELREMRAAQAAQQQQLETTREASEISRNFAQAQATMNNVNNPNQKKE